MPKSNGRNDYLGGGGGFIWPPSGRLAADNASLAVSASGIANSRLLEPPEQPLTPKQVTKRATLKNNFFNS